MRAGTAIGILAAAGTATLVVLSQRTTPAELTSAPTTPFFTTTTSTTTTTTTTTTTGTTGLQTAKPAPKPAPKPETIVEPYRLPGYTGPIGCAMPMSSSEFDDARKSVADKSFEETRLTLAKQIGRDRCFTTDQVKQMMGVFSFEESRLDFAKWAYERTHDKGNYYKVNDAFSFSSSIDELNEHIQSR